MSTSKYVHHLYKKRFSIVSYEFWMIVLVMAATLLRFILIVNHWPGSNSDEAIIGLMAKHIAKNGEFPIFFYGQSYMGPVEAYVCALLIPLFGASVFTLRLVLLGFFACFLVSMYFLTRLLYNRPLALATVGLLSLGSSNLFLHQLRGIGGYPELVGLGAVLFLLASSLALSSQPAGEKLLPAIRRKRCLHYALYGFLAGFSIWTDQLILPWIATTGLLILLFCYRELRWRTVACVLLGLLIGAGPLIYYNVTAPLSDNSITVLLNLQHSGAASLAALPMAYLRQPIGSLLNALPAITGIHPLCPTESLPLFGPTTTKTFACTAWHGGWALGYLVLWISAAFLAVRQISQQWKPKKVQTPAERTSTILQCARLLLLLSALLTLVSYTLSPAAAISPGITSRYLICIQIVTPALLWPLWCGFSDMRYKKSRQAQFANIGRAAILLLIACVFLQGTIRTFEDVPNAQAFYTQDESLIHSLLGVGATRIYSDYWTCGRISLQSDEQIICSNLDNALRPVPDRYLPYGIMVREKPESTYIFARDAPQLTQIESTLHQSKLPYQQYVFGHYIMYKTQVPLSK